VTQLLTPELRAGSLLIFPSEYIHGVNPYNGSRPRLSMSWNVNVEKLPGNPADGWKK
jgi:predicted 2-oxoglutarate/Fe(II)-dependent dioxygenase YbiX